MIIGLLKSFLYMFLFYFFLRMFNYIVKFIYYFRNNKIDNDENKFKDNDTLKMVQCEKCKIYISKSDALINNGKFFCKKEHFD